MTTLTLFLQNFKKETELNQLLKNNFDINWKQLWSYYKFIFESLYVSSWYRYKSKFSQSKKLLFSINWIKL